MADPELGQKRACPSCGGKFYDLTKHPAECPYCEAVFNPEDLVRGRGRKAAVVEEEKPKAAAKKPAKEEDEDDDGDVPDDLEDVDVDDDDDGDDDDVLEDASDLGEDDSDLDEVLEHVEKPEKDS